MLIGPEGVQDGLGIVLVRFFFHLAVRVRFFVPLGLVLGSSWGAFGSVLGRLGLFWPRFGALRWAFLSVYVLSCLFVFAFVAAGLGQITDITSYQLISSSTLNSHQLINSSTHQFTYQLYSPMFPL